jgi:hypothetical protein
VDWKSRNGKILNRYTKRDIICMETRVGLPWIPEPSTVNNKLKCREGSGIQGRVGRFRVKTENHRKNPGKKLCFLMKISL